MDRSRKDCEGTPDPESEDESRSRESHVTGTQTPILSRPSPIPDHVGPYAILDTLGRGGMGVVYRARHITKGSLAALKMVFAPNAAALAGIRQEIAVLMDTRHPGIVRIVEADTSSATPWFAMELLEGETLEHRLRRVWSEVAPGDAEPGNDKPVAGAGRMLELSALIAKVCEPLAFMHAAGVVHGDIKPANIFLRRGTEPVIVDFGLVSLARGAIGRERVHAVAGIAGTAAYLAPEVIQGEVPDARADLYALGCVLFEALTGAPPYRGPTPGSVLTQHLYAPVPSLGSRVIDCTDAVERLVTGLLAKDPAHRIDHAMDVATALGALLPGTPSPTTRGPAYLFRPRLVGRADILHDLTTYVQTAHGGQGRLLLIAGESGVGKSFFTTELCRLAAFHGLQVVTAECTSLVSSSGDLADAEGPPLHAFRSVLEAVGDNCRELGPAETRRIFGEHHGLMARYEPSLASLPHESHSAAAAELPAFAARERTIRALHEVLLAFVQNRPLLLAIDDLQWADDLSVAVLDTFGPEFFARAPLLIVGIYRIDESDASLQRLAAKPSVRLVQLGRLNMEEVASMIGGMLSLGEPPTELVRFVYAHSEGIPFFVAEYVRTLAAEGILHRTSGRWRLAPQESAPNAIRPVSLPTSLAQLVRRRLRGLSTELTNIVEVGSVLGRTFPIDLLATACELERLEIESVMQHLVSRQVLNSTGGDRYSFLHDSIRETVYAGLSEARRRELHARAADSIELHFVTPGDRAPQYAALAHHHRAAGQQVRALHYAEQAASYALELSAHADAVRHVREALALADALPAQLVSALARARSERLLADALQGLGSVAESEEPLRRASTLLGQPIPAQNWRVGARMVVEAARHVQLRMSRWARRTAVREPTAAELELGRVLDRLQRVYYFTSDDPRLLFTNLCTLNAASGCTPTPELAIAYGFTAAVLDIMLHASKLAESYLQLAAAALAHDWDPAAESHIQMLWALYHEGHGRFRQGIERADRAVELARQTGFFRRQAESLAVRTGLELLRGDPVAARAVLAQLSLVTSRRDDAQMSAWTALQFAHADLLQGEYVSARAQLEAAAELCAALGRSEQIWLCGLFAWLEQSQARFEVAEEHCRTGMRLASIGPPRHLQCLDAYARLAEVALALAKTYARGRHAVAYRADARAACALLTRAARSFPVAMPAAQLHRGTLDWLIGNRDSARRRWAQGVDLAQAMDLPRDEVRLRRARLVDPNQGLGERMGDQDRVESITRQLGLVGLFESLALDA